MGNLAVFPALILDATRHRVHIWLCWVQIGCIGLILALTWLPYLRRRGDDLPRALVMSGLWVLVLTATVLNLLSK
jgi:hypothetical protein